MRWSNLLLACCCLATLPAWALDVGQSVDDVKLRDGKSNDEVPLPDLGKKVLTFFYTDADVADMNDPLGDAMKAKKLSLDHHKAIGVVNLADSKAPNFIIRAVVRKKIEKYDITILTDPDRLMAKAWGLRDANNSSVVVVVGRDKKVLYVKNGPVRGDEINTVIGIIEGAMGPAAAPAPAAPAPAAAAPTTPEAPAATPEAPAAEPTPAAPKP